MSPAKELFGKLPDGRILCINAAGCFVWEKDRWVKDLDSKSREISLAEILDDAIRLNRSEMEALIADAKERDSQ